MKELTCSNNINLSLTGDIGNKPNTLELLHYNDSKSCLVSNGLQPLQTLNEDKK